MADEKTVEVELLADGIRLHGQDYVRGDIVTLPEGFAKTLQSHGSVGPKGTIAKIEKAREDRAEAERRFQRHMQGLGSLDEVAEAGNTADESEAAAAEAQAKAREETVKPAARRPAGK